MITYILDKKEFDKSVKYSHLILGCAISGSFCREKNTTRHYIHINSIICFWFKTSQLLVDFKRKHQLVQNGVMFLRKPIQRFHFSCVHLILSTR